MILAIILAAIITEQNNVGTYAPDYATFDGNSAGIAASWIPYGTYTGGTGSTEYTRATSNLVGVVASVYDGYQERLQMPNIPSWLAGDPFPWYYPTPPATNIYANAGDFLQALHTNYTQRILNALNPGRALVFTCERGTSCYTTEHQGIERMLAETEEYWPGSGDWCYVNGGLAGDPICHKFASRALDGLVGRTGSTEPPIGTSWSTNLPFRVEDSDAWNLTWPTFSALTNDVHFFPAGTGGYHHCDRPWSLGIGNVSGLWGQDFFDAADDLITNIVRRCLPITMEDVLSVDTGFLYEVPPVETNSYWTVSGTLGDFTCRLVDDYGQFDKRYLGQGTDTNYLCEVFVSSGTESKYLDLSVFQSGVTDRTFYGWDYYNPDVDTYYIGPDAYSPTWGSYDARRTSLATSRDDFAHWRNYTTRLDWKRLGIICQLERQMELTYSGFECDQDMLTFSYETFTGTMRLTADVPVVLTTPRSSSALTVEIPVSSFSWTGTTNFTHSTTNATGWCVPTARCGKSSVGGSIYNAESSVDNTFVPIILTKSDLEQLIQACGIPQTLSGAGKFRGYFSHGESYSPPAALIKLNGCEIFDGTTWNNQGESGWLSLWVPNTNYTARLTCEINRFIPAVWTHIHGDAESARLLSRIAEHDYPVSNVWAQARVASQIRPSLEMMISLTGDKALDYVRVYQYDLITSKPEELNWDTLQPYSPYRGRWFRMNPLATQQATKRQSDLNRYIMLANLDNEVKQKFADLAGFSIADLPQMAQVSLDDKNDVLSELSVKNITATFGIGSRAREVHFVDGDIIANNGVLTDITSVRVYDERGEILANLTGSDLNVAIRSAGWMFDTVDADTHTNATAAAVVVDGHQAQMIKTLWRFKNLRDPTL